MKCRTCDYPLWNIAPGPCPECGDRFDPTDFDYPEGRIHFCCPHCDQHYFGDGVGGHLSPSAFDCVQCGSGITERECTLRPVPGFTDAELELAATPWFDHRRSPFRRFIDTIGWAMVKPARLGGMMPATGVLIGGIFFTSLVHFGSALLGFGTVALFVLIFATIASNLGQAFGVAMTFLVLSTIFALGGVLAIMLQGVVAHGILRVTGPVRHSMGTTVGITCFASGPIAISAVPCLGQTCLGSVGMIWACISSILAIKAAQAVATWRAVLAGVFLPTLAIVLYISVLILVETTQGAAGLNAPVVQVATPQGEIVIGDRVAAVDGEFIAAEIEDAVALPGVAVVVGGAGVEFKNPVGILPTPVGFEGTGFSGWWVPGLLVFKATAGAAVAEFGEHPAGRLPSSEMPLVAIRLQGRANLPARSRVISPPDALMTLRTSISRMGGDGDTLSRAVVSDWLAASLAARDARDRIEALGDRKDSGTSEPEASAPEPDASPPSSRIEDG